MKKLKLFRIVSLTLKKTRTFAEQFVQIMNEYINIMLNNSESVYVYTTPINSKFK